MGNMLPKLFVEAALNDRNGSAVRGSISPRARITNRRSAPPPALSGA